MSDISTIKDSEKVLTRPSRYDNFYNPIVSPYNFQNFESELINTNSDIITNELIKAIQQRLFHWIKVINTEDYENEEDATEEKRITTELGELIQKYYGFGNRNLLINPNIAKEALINKGFDIAKNQILYPQSLLCWSNVYLKWYAVWYTPIKEDFEEQQDKIYSKTDCETYIKNIINQDNFLNNDTRHIILRISDELGFDTVDILSVGGRSYPETEKVLTVREGIQKWSNDLDTIQKYYQQIKAISDNPELINNYMFVDDNVNLFHNLRKSYFIFKIFKNNYQDIDIDIDFDSIPQWEPNTKYLIGSYVLTEKNYVYYCVLDTEPEETFSEYTLRPQKNTDGTTVDVSILQWKLIDTEYAKELAAIQKVGTIDLSQYYRFVFPALEERRKRELYPNGRLKPDGQKGNLIVTNTNINSAKDFIYVVPTLNYDEGTGVETVEYIANLNPRDNFFKVNSSQKVIIYFKKSSYDNKLISIILEEKINTIIDRAFYLRDDLIKVVLRSGVNVIEDRAFGGCINLQQFVFPKNCQVLGAAALAGCSSLRRATIPPYITVLDGTFNGCTSLVNVSLNENCEQLGDSCFSNCENLQKVYNLTNIKKIGKQVFLNCKELRTVTLSDKITEIPDRAFKNCEKAIFKINNKKVTRLGAYSFDNCKKLTETVDFDNLIELGEGAYRNCSSLTSITFKFSNKNKEKIIPKNFCYGCYGLRELILNDNWGENETAKVLDDSCFQNCINLQRVRIPETVERLGTNVFYDCFKLKILEVPTLYPNDSGRNSSWIENELIISEANRINWIDPTFTTVTNYNGVVLKWKKAILKY